MTNSLRSMECFQWTKSRGGLALSTSKGVTHRFIHRPPPPRPPIYGLLSVTRETVITLTTHTNVSPTSCSVTSITKGIAYRLQFNYRNYTLDAIFFFYLLQWNYPNFFLDRNAFPSLFNVTITTYNHDELHRHASMCSRYPSRASPLCFPSTACQGYRLPVLPVIWSLTS